jgi:chemotaxis protein methyltransferase CheR
MGLQMSVTPERRAARLRRAKISSPNDALETRRGPAHGDPFAPAAPGTDFEYADADFERIRKLIYREAGIKLCPSKRTMAYGRLVRRLRALGIKRFSDYLDLVESGNDQELQAFTNALTTNLTSFFRESHHFPVLVQYLTPRVSRREVMIWCAGCSTGEEPYSMAMALNAAFGTAMSRIHILATDVDTSVLETAERGVYPIDRIEKLPSGYKERFFYQGTGKNSGYVKVRSELGRSIMFRQVNLLEASWPIRAPIDAIFCRNVMIYFDKTTQQGILERFAGLLENGGLLFAGHSENFTQAGNIFRSLGRTVYERLSSPAARSSGRG